MDGIDGAGILHDVPRAELTHRFLQDNAQATPCTRDRDLGSVLNGLDERG
jgi:hypothetical protein